MDIRTLCLGILTIGDASGYEIKKVFEDELSHFYDASYGSIYPALTRLTDDGLVSCQAMAQERRPDKKVYAITTAGRMAFMDALVQKPRMDKLRSDFLAILRFADLLPARHLAQLIDERVAEYRARGAELTGHREQAGGPAQQFIAGYGAALYLAAADYLTDNRHLVEGEALLSTASVAS